MNKEKVAEIEKLHGRRLNKDERRIRAYYQNDPFFHRTVVLMYDLIINGRCSSKKLKEAIICAGYLMDDKNAKTVMNPSYSPFLQEKTREQEVRGLHCTKKKGDF